MSSHKKYEEEHFVDSTKPVWNYSLFNDEDIENFRNGTHYSLYKKFGSHPLTVLEKEWILFFRMGAQCNAGKCCWRF